jgi:hypothetical protein
MPDFNQYAKFDSTILQTVNELIEKPNVLITLHRLMNYEIYNFLDHLDNYTLHNVRLIPNNYTHKPSCLDIQRMLAPLTSEFDPMSLAAWIKHPEYRHLLPFTKNYNNLSEEFTQICKSHDLNVDQIDSPLIAKLLNKFKRVGKKLLYIYAAVPTDLRQITTNTDLTRILSFCSYSEKTLQGVVVKMESKAPRIIELANDLPHVSELSTTMALAYIDSMLNKQINMSKFYIKIGNNYMTFPDAVKIMTDFWTKNIGISSLVSLYLNILKIPVSMKRAFYMYYEKSQIKINKKWLGRGILCINTSHGFMKLNINNSDYTSIDFNFPRGVVPVIVANYINLCLRKMDLRTISELMTEEFYMDRTQICLGQDENLSMVVDQAYRLKKVVTFGNYRPDLNNNLDIENLRLSFEGVNIVAVKDDELSGFQQYKLTVLPVSSKTFIDLIPSLIANIEENTNIIHSFSKDYEEFFINYLLPSKHTSLSVDFDEIIPDNVTNSILYKIYYHCVPKDITFQRCLKEPDLPFMEDGIVNAIINYKEKIDNNIKLNMFNTRVGFISELQKRLPSSLLIPLGDKLKKLHDQVLNPQEQLELLSQVRRIMTAFENKDASYEKELLNVLSYWGYHTTIGGIINYSFKRDISSYQTYRLISVEGDYVDRYHDLFPELMQILFRLINMSNINSKQYNKVGNNLKASNVLYDFAIFSVSSCYFSTPKLYVTISEFKEVICQLIDMIFDNDVIRDHLDQLIKNDLKFMGIPVEQGNVGNFKMLVLTLHRYYVYKNCKNEKLDYSKTQSNTFYKELKTFLPNFPLRMIKNCCLYDVNTIKNVAAVLRKLTKRDFQYGEISSLKLPFSSHVEYANVVVEDDAYENALLELESQEPDEDELENFQNDIQYEENSESKFIFLFGLTYDDKTIHYINNISFEIIVITDSAITSLEKSRTKNRKYILRSPQNLGFTYFSDSIIVYHIRGSRNLSVKNSPFLRYTGSVDQSQYLVYDENNELVNEVKMANLTTKDLMIKSALQSTYRMTETDIVQEYTDALTEKEADAKKLANDNAKLQEDIDMALSDYVDVFKKYRLSDELINDLKTSIKNRIKKATTLEQIMSYISEMNVVKEVLGEKINTLIKSLNRNMQNVVYHKPYYFDFINVEETINSALTDNKVKAEDLAIFCGLIDDVFCGRASLTKLSRQGLLKNFNLIGKNLTPTFRNYNSVRFILGMTQCIMNDVPAGEDISKAKFEVVKDRLMSIMFEDDTFDEMTDRHKDATLSIPTNSNLPYKVA